MDTDGTNLKAVLNRRVSPTSAWAVAREVDHVVPRINQKDAFIVVGNVAFTYAVNWGSVALEECYFTLTAGTSSAACNHVLVSGSVWKPPANSNYIGASVCCGGTGRVIWFTTVGDNGAPGSWTYLANYGGGWNGPFVFSLNAIGFNDFAYVAAYWDPKSTTRMHFVGQGIVGAYANCGGTCFRIAVGELDLAGQETKMTVLGDAGANQLVMSRGAVWVSPHGDVHVLAARLHPKFEIAYYMKPATAASWGTHAITQRAVLPAGSVGATIATAGDTIIDCRSTFGFRKHMQFHRNAGCTICKPMCDLD